MIILRQKIYAKSDYEGLGKFPSKQLRKDRNKIAKELMKERKRNNKEFTNKPPLLKRLFGPQKSDQGSIEIRNEKHSNSLKWAKEAADAAKKSAKFQDYYLKHPNSLLEEVTNQQYRLSN